MDHEEIAHIYHDYDLDGDGLSIKELGRALRASGIFLPRQEIKKAMRDFDESGDGRLDLTEFTALCDKLSEEEAEHHHEEARANSTVPPAPQDMCPDGHAMMIRSSNPAGYGNLPAQCNLCQGSVDFTARFRHCPKCQYDVCHRCRARPPAPRCAQGHPMAELYVDPPEYGGSNACCDKCTKIINAKLGMAHCKVCKYDLCSSCKQPNAPAAAAAPPKPPLQQQQQQPTAVAKPRGAKALFVGINYQGSPHALRGCANDVRTLQHLLKFLKTPISESRVYSDDTSLGGLSGPPTKRNMLDGIDWLVRGAMPGDSLVFHYSGHGTQVTNHASNEEDGKEEALCPVDMDSAGLIIDDELLTRLVRPLPSGVRLTIIMDCCHSGSMLDLPHTFTATREAINAARATGVASQVSRGGGSEPLKASVFCISGCADSQTSADVSTTAGFRLHPQVNSNGAGGACTSALAESLCEKPDISLVDLLSEMRSNLKARGFTQVPQLSSSKPIATADTFKLSGGGGF